MHRYKSWCGRDDIKEKSNDYYGVEVAEVSDGSEISEVVGDRNIWSLFYVRLN